MRESHRSNRIAPREPINLTEWTSRTDRGHKRSLFTCGRPGRAIFGQNRLPVGCVIIDKWVEGLPGAEVWHIVSLLGRKKDGFSEFGYYPFRSAKEPGEKPTFQEWFDQRYQYGRFIVHEFPTTDARGIPPDVAEAAKGCILELLESSRNVVVLGSAGAERTARICEPIGYKKANQI